MAVDPFMPGSMYTGADFQEWQYRQKEIKPPPDPPVVSAPDFSAGASLPNYDSPSGALDTLPAEAAAAHGHSRPRGPGLVGQLGEGSANMAHGVVKHVWPLKACVALGEGMVSAPAGVKLLLAVPCALIAAGIAGSSGADGGGVLAALAIGGVAGWVLLFVLGFLLVVAAELIGLAIGLALIALALGLVYVVIAAMVR
jgi:hypothetical protein